jgi:hypothetical protein
MEQAGTPAKSEQWRQSADSSSARSTLHHE